MSDRRKLLFFSICVLVLVTLSGVGLTAYHTYEYAIERERLGAEQVSLGHPIVLSVFNTLIVMVAGGTLLVRVVNPFIRLLQDVKARLEWKVAEMDHFMQALSHDMTANALLLESTFCQLRDNCTEKTDPGIRNGLIHLEACLGESQRFLDDLRELARTGSVQMEPSVVEVAHAVQDVLKEQSEFLRERRIVVTIEGDLNTAWCNENRVRQVLTNLIRNAARHGCDRKNPRITICPASPPNDFAQGNCVWLKIHDNGTGIPEAFRHEIFLPGRRLPSADPDGTGMGLSIVKKVVDHYGGTIFVDAQTTAGTSFVFGLPKASLEQILSSAMTQKGRDEHRMTIPAPSGNRRGSRTLNTER